MYKQKENIKALIARITTIGLFLFIIFLSKSPECSTTGLSKHHDIVVNVTDDGNKAIPESIVYLTNLSSSIVSCEISTLNTCNNNNFRIFSSNQKAGQLFKKCMEQFIEIKPFVFNFDSYHIGSLPNDEIPLIS
jgi:hypothetical protein